MEQADREYPPGWEQYGDAAGDSAPAAPEPTSNLIAGFVLALVGFCAWPCALAAIWIGYRSANRAEAAGASRTLPIVTVILGTVGLLAGLYMMMAVYGR